MTDLTPKQKLDLALERNRAVADLLRATTPDEKAAIIARLRLTDADAADALAAKFAPPETE